MRNWVLPYVGVGITFRGKTFRTQQERAESVAVVTRWIVFGWLPIVPLSSWLVRDRGMSLNDFKPTFNNYALIEQVPLFWKQIALSWGLTLLTLLLIALLQFWLARRDARTRPDQDANPMQITLTNSRSTCLICAS